MPVIELLEFPASEAFLADPAKLASGPLGTVSKAEGCIGAYHAMQIDDKKTALFVIVWETFEHHKKVIDAPDYPALIEQIKPCMGGAFQMMHVPLENIATAFSAPATEIAMIKLQEGKAKEELVPKADALIVELDKVCHPPSVWGESREYPGVYVLAIGWDSMEDHVEAVKIDPFPKLIGDVKTVADISLSHYALKKYIA